ncbi:hypothetical protein E4656_06700 [Natronospirillum operosum]|uniref:TIGR03016 family PEP-CTERM system-associated outer membrane protein n=1 Tax=Natronospirillum operosum TaxID=2759953 RepID=A0A4Z0W755_9GAMM|nr:DUF1302 family protein [Natronospirillum operosum]TGG93874.1 hypothetical protein E4656_06700 [Natronospirillum operosum]
MKVRTTVAAAFLLLGANAAGAEDFFEMSESEPTRSADRDERAIDLSATFTQRIHYAVTEQRESFPFRREDRGLASVRSDLLLTARHRPASDLVIQVAGLASYDAKLNDDPATVEVEQTYVEWGMTPAFNIKTGRQIISLGESNYFQIADRINPIDERAFGLAELRESSLPVTSTRLSYYQSRWGVDLVALHEFRQNLYDEPRGDFDPYIALRDQPLAIEEDTPDTFMIVPDIAGRLFWSLPWGDVALFASRLHNREARPLKAGADVLTLDYPQITLLGASGNLVLGNWLLKSEYAFSDGDLYHVEHDENTQTLSAEGQAHQLMVGGRYTGISNLTLDVELLNTIISSVDGSLDEDRARTQGVANLEYEMLNDDLVASLTYMGWVNEPASMLRARMDYAVRDDIVLFGGAIGYSASDDAMLAPYRNNDRVFVGVTINL